MSVLNDTWRFLVERRLWPVAILLVAAAAAVPMLLAEDPAPAPAASTAAVKADKDSVLATEPLVVQAADGDRAGRRRVLGSRKDPFKPKATPTPTPKPTDSEPAQQPAQPGGTTSVDVGGSAPSGGGSPEPFAGTPVVPQTTPKKRTYELYELAVRFGESEGGISGRRNVKRLQALPSAADPVLIYLGVLADKKTAVFMLDSGVVAQGDGSCKPSTSTCETIHLREGETEFFDVPASSEEEGGSGGAQYQLDVIKIRKKSTTSAKQAKRAKARVSKQGRQILRARIAGDGPLRYRYDQQSGRLEKLSKKAYKAVVAKAAKAARASF